jgi:uncharacterized membrane protein YhiD involved in acid resistance
VKSGKVNLDPRRKKETLTLVVVFLGVLLASAFAVYFLAGRTARPDASRESVQQTSAQPSPDASAAERRPSPPRRTDETLIDDVFGAPPSREQVSRESWGEVVAGLTLRLSLAALLGAVLAFRPRRRVLALKRNPYVAQTQILLAVVAAALMIIVGDNAARAFGIFAAVSVVRFRTNIRDPKEITVLLISLAIGLGTGVGRWDLAVILTIFSLLALWVLEYREPEQVFRALNLKVATRNVEGTQRAIREVLKRHNFDSELRAMGGPSAEGKAGSLVYLVDISPNVSTDELSEEILALDSPNIDGIEWEQKKSFSYLYQ